MSRYIPFDLTLHSPLLLSDVGADPNSSVSLPYVSGAAIRGVVARNIGDPSRNPEKRKRFDDLVLNGRVQYLNAYPLADGRRTVPAPVSIHRPKDEPAADDPKHYDLSADERWPDHQLLPADFEFVTIDSAEVLAVSVTREGSIHQQRDRSRGRAWSRETDEGEEGVGTVFNYQAVCADQTFGGLLRIDGDEQLENVVKAILMKECLLLGRSRRSEYGGGASIEFKGENRSRELQATGASIEAGAKFRCILLSRCIIRDPSTGQIDPEYLATLVEQILGGRASVQQAFTSFTVVGGFNRKWRLQLPQALALEAGSVFVFKASQRIDSSELARIEDSGVGERCVEGFGRIAFLDTAERCPTIEVFHPEPARPPLGMSVPPIVLDIQRRIIRSRLEQEVDRMAAELIPDENLPSTSLLGRLRVPFRQGPEKGLKTIAQWIAEKKETDQSEEAPARLKRPAMDQLTSCRLGNKQDLATWLRETSATSTKRGPLDGRKETIAQRNQLVSDQPGAIPASALGAIDEMDSVMRARLIDTTLALLAIRGRRKESS
jgi:CRISPR-associated protein Csx10